MEKFLNKKRSQREIKTKRVHYTATLVAFCAKR